MLQAAAFPFTYPSTLPHDFERIMRGVVRQHGLFAYDIHPVPGGVIATLQNMDWDTKHFGEVHTVEGFTATLKQLQEAVPSALAQSRVATPQSTVNVVGSGNQVAVGSHINQSVHVASALAPIYEELKARIAEADVSDADKADAQTALDKAQEAATPERAMAWLEVLGKVGSLAEKVPAWAERVAALIHLLGA